MHIPLNPSAKLRINTKEHKCFIVSLALFFNFHLNLTKRSCAQTTLSRYASGQKPLCFLHIIPKVLLFSLKRKYYLCGENKSHLTNHCF